MFKKAKDGRLVVVTGEDFNGGKMSGTHLRKTEKRLGVRRKGG